MKIEKIPAQLSVYKHPVISLIVPPSWIDEAQRYANYQVMAASDPSKVRPMFLIAKRLGVRAFCRYFDMQDYWQEKHLDWTNPRRYIDVEMFYNDNQIDYIINVSTETDWAPKYGKVYRSICWKANRNKNPVMHVFAVYSIPSIDIIGVIPNSELQPQKNEVTEDMLYPVYNDKLLRSIDRRCLYV